MVDFRVEYKPLSETLVNFLDKSNMFYKESLLVIKKRHPRLISKLAKSDVSSAEKIIFRYVEEFVNKNREQLEKARSKLEAAWQSVEADVVKRLFEIMQVDWEQTIICHMGITEIYPRYLDERRFEVYFDEPIFMQLTTIVHEITHFLYFKKWGELFPGDHKDTYESPHPFWHLSEIVAPIVANDDVILKLVPDVDICGYPNYNYTSFDERGSVSIQGYFRKMYIREGNFSRFLVKARQKVQQMSF